MKNVHLRMFIVLIVVGAFSGGSLATMYKFTKVPIQENQQRELKEAIFKALPEAKNYSEATKIEDIIIYEGVGEKGEIVGYAMAGKGAGFQGDIKLIVGLDNELESVTGLEILESLETPGLGAKIQEKPFKSQFLGMKIPSGTTIGCVKSKKDKKETDIQAVTGATISSEAVVKIVNELIEEARKSIPKTKD